MTPLPLVPSGADHVSARVLQVARYLAYLRDFNSVTTLMRTSVRQILNCEGSTFILREGEEVHYVDEDAVSPLWKGRKFPAWNCISGWAMIHREAVAIPDIYEDARIPQNLYKPTFVRSLAIMPIRFEDPLGAIGAYWGNRHVPTPEELHALRGLADLTALVLPGVFASRETRH